MFYLLLMFTASICWAAEPAAGTDTFAVREPRYTLSPNDTVELSFTFTPELNQVLTVQPDGFISLRGASDIKVGGLTVPEAKAAIVKAYSSMLHEPVISLALKEFVKPTFVVSGGVEKPGRYDLHGQTTLTDALAIAGGPTLDGKASAILLIRRVSPDTAEVKKFNVKDMQTKGRLEEDPYLHPGDSIYVSQSGMGKLDRFMKITRLGLYLPLPAIP
jgi:polysaccharide biosynthesis/export protein